MLQCSFVEQRNYKVIYRRYASLFFIVGVDGEEVTNSMLLKTSITATSPASCCTAEHQSAMRSLASCGGHIHMAALT